MSMFAPKIAVLLIGTSLLASPAGAQQKVMLAGVVADEMTSTPVASAKVTLLGTDLETRSLSNGTFEFAGLAPGPVTIRVEAPGFATMVQEVVLREDAVVFAQFILSSLAAFLDEILVVGRAPERGANLTETRTAADLLAGKVPGVASNSGLVGLNLQTVQLRGVSSFMIQGEPDLFLNGARMAGGFRDALAILEQIPANDVQDIQILRGPVAAFLHGSADGAIFIRTKSGPDQ